jgi:hypothetical protein
MPPGMVFLFELGFNGEKLIPWSVLTGQFFAESSKAVKLILCQMIRA